MVGILIWIKCVVISFVLSDLAGFAGELLSELRFIFKKKISAFIFNLFVYLLSCPRCFSFWFSLIATGDLFIAAVVSISVDLLKGLEWRYIKKDTEL